MVFHCPWEFRLVFVRMSTDLNKHVPNMWLCSMPQIKSKKPKLLVPYCFWLRKGQMWATKTQWRTYKLAMLRVQTHYNTRGQHDCLQVLRTIFCSKTRDTCQTTIMSIHPQRWYFDCLMFWLFVLDVLNISWSIKVVEQRHDWLHAGCDNHDCEVLARVPLSGECWALRQNCWFQGVPRPVTSWFWGIRVNIATTHCVNALH